MVYSVWCCECSLSYVKVMQYCDKPLLAFKKINKNGIIILKTLVKV